MEASSGAGTSWSVEQFVGKRVTDETSCNIRFRSAASNWSINKDDGAKSSSARERLRTAGSETLYSRLGGDWSSPQ